MIAKYTADRIDYALERLEIAEGDGSGYFGSLVYSSAGSSR